jgi:hypothetical protein
VGRSAVLLPCSREGCARHTSDTAVTNTEKKWMPREDYDLLPQTSD